MWEGCLADKLERWDKKGEAKRSEGLRDGGDSEMYMNLNQLKCRGKELSGDTPGTNIKHHIVRRQAFVAIGITNIVVASGLRNLTNQRLRFVDEELVAAQYYVNEIALKM